jgi:hypothetical protein
MQMIRFLKKFNLKKLKYFDQLLINCILASILQPSTLRPTHTGHLNPRRRCDGKHSLKVKGEIKTEVLENRVLRRTFGLKKDEVTTDWRKLHNKELRKLYSST